MGFGKHTYNIDKETARINLVEPIRSKADIKRIIDYFDEHGWHKYAVIFKFGVYTGLRISDILNLKVYEIRNTTHIWIREVKTGKGKKFPLKKELQELLTDFAGDRPDNEWAFVGWKNSKLGSSQVYRKINEAALDLQIDANVGTHTIRKTFGYHHYRQFKNIALLQEIFNHADAGVTLNYIGITQDEQDESYLKLNLEHDPEDLGNIDYGNSRLKLRRVVKFLNSYRQGGGQIHLPFAQIILELIQVNDNKCWVK